MKRIVLILFVICLSCFLPCCTKEKPRPTARAVQIITENYSVYEPNPIHADEANTLNELFRHSLKNRNTLDLKERTIIYAKVMALYEEDREAESALEDAVDESRSMMHESIALSIAALVSEPEDARTYFERAKASLRSGGHPAEFLEDEYSALLMLEALYLSEHKAFNDANKKVMISIITVVQKDRPKLPIT